MMPSTQFRLRGPAWRAVAAFLFALAPSAQTQQPPAISVRVDWVRVSVAVTDTKGNFVRDLRKEDFRLLDEGVEQKLAYFEAVEAPARVVLLVETGPAVYLISQQHLAAAQLLLEGLAPEDEVAMATYSDVAALRADFTKDKRAAAQTLISPQFSLGRGNLNLFDSLATILGWLREGAGKKSIVLLSTGLDAGPPNGWDALRESLRATDVSIYTVALGGSLRESSPRNKKLSNEQDAYVAAGFAKADENLKEIAQITGGRAFFPRDGKDLAKIYRQIAVALRNQYQLGVNSEARGGQYRKLQVQFPAKKQSWSWKIFARQGYIAPR